MVSVYDERYQAVLDRLRLARRRARLSQSEVARRLHRPQSYVSRCESGERRVDIVEIEEFAAIYGVDVTYFLSDTDEVNQ